MISSSYDINAPSIGGAGFSGMPFGGGFGGPGFFGGGFGLAPFGLFGLLGGLCGRGGFDDGCHGGGRGRGGHDDGGCRQAIFDATILGKISDIQSAIPAGTVAVNQNTNAAAQGIKDSLVSLASGVNQGFQQQLLATLNSTNTLQNAVQGVAVQNAQQTNELASLIASTACATKTLILEDGDRTRALITANRISELQDQLAEERHGRRSRDTEINVSQVVNQTQVQAQAQLQAQQQAQLMVELLNEFRCMKGDINQLQKSTNAAIQVGAGNQAGQASTPTQVGRI